MGNIAYRLRDEHRGVSVPAIDPDTGEASETDTVLVGGYEGGTIGVPPDGEPFDVGKALEDGDGLIVIEETQNHLSVALDSYGALERTDAPDEATAVGYASQKVPDLKADAYRRGLEGISSLNKGELVELLQRHDDLVAAGDPDAARTINETPEG